MKKSLIFSLSIVIVVIAVAGLYMFSSRQPGKYDQFATCLKDQGALFYGAFWCPHCQDQKKMFGSSAKLLPYIECSLPDASGQTPVCKEKEIKGYPTWIFADGTQGSGTLTLAELAEKTSCSLPEQSS